MLRPAFGARFRAAFLSGLILFTAAWTHHAAFGASLPAAEAANGMVVSAQRLAAEAGVEMLRRGGNAVDAAVAVGYAEAVTNPCCGNIGGGGFMTVHLADGRAVFLNFREMAPAAATQDMYLDASGQVIRGSSLVGWKAVAVPGTVAGLDAALVRYGTLPRSVVMDPAIRLARDGFVLTRGDTDIITSRAEVLRRDPAASRIFFRPDGTDLEPGDLLIQSDLARTLATIADQGPEAFYFGRIPQVVEAASRAGGGIITAADFVAYHITVSEPLRCTYRGYEVLSAPPPSSGGATICQILNILEGYDIRRAGWHSSESIRLVTEAMRHAYVDRNTHLGDPAFVANPLDRLLSKDYAASIRAKIGPRATPSAELRSAIPAPEKPQTTHYSVADKAGNAVSVTFTLNGGFGAGVMAGDTGFLLNNEMDDFTVKVGVPNMFGLVQGEANAIAPGKRPLSSMAPTIVLQDGRVFMVLGSPGGSRIITIVLQTLMNMIDHRMAPQEAVDAPRVHHQWLPDTIYYERFALSADTRVILRDLGYALTAQSHWGAAALIAVGANSSDRSTVESSGNDATATKGMRPGLFYGANDPRRPAGAAIGY